MAGRLAGQSSLSLCKRVLDHSRLICGSTGNQAELFTSDDSNRDVGQDNVLASLGRFRSAGPLVPTSRDLLGGAAQDVSSSHQGNFSRFRQFSGAASFVRATDVLVTRSLAVNHQEDLRKQFGRKFHSSSENIVHPTPGGLHLPELVNHTSELVKSVCSALEKQEWQSETVKIFKEANMVISSYPLRLILQRIQDENVAWNFFLWARENASMKLSLRVYIALLDCLGRARNLELTKQTMKFVVADGHTNSAWPYNNSLKWFSDDVDTALYFWELMKENKCRPTVVTYTRMIDVLTKFGRIEAACEIFKKMLQDGCPPNITTYNVLIYALGDAGQTEAASSLFEKLTELGCKPSDETYNTLIIMHAKSGDTETALKYLSMLKATGAEVADDIYEALHIPLPDGASRAVPPEGKSGEPAAEGSVEAPAVPEFDYRYNDMIPGSLIKANRLVRMLQTGDQHWPIEKILDKIRPRLSSRLVVQVMKQLKYPEVALIFFDWVKRQPNFKHNEYSYSMIISILGRSGNSEAIGRILNEMNEQGIKINTQIFTALITGYGRSKSVDGAMQLFQQMEGWGCKPDTVTYTSLIHMLAKHGKHEEANEMFKQMQQVGCAANEHTYSVVIYNHLKSGNVNEAFELLKQMPELGSKPTPVTYATLIHHCTKDGHVELAKKILTMMENDGVKPSRVLVSQLASCLSKAGMREEAEALSRRLNRQRIWDSTYKVPTEKVARELIFEKFLAGETNSTTAPVQS